MPWFIFTHHSVCGALMCLLCRRLLFSVILLAFTRSIPTGRQPAHWSSAYFPARVLKGHRGNSLDWLSYKYITSAKP